MAARIRRELQSEVDLIRGGYGEFRFLVDGKTVIDGGAAAVFGVLPSKKKIVEAIRKGLSEEPAAG